MWLPDGYPCVSCRQIVLEIGINPNLLSRWRREADAETDKAFKGSGSPRDEEVARLKRELARVKKERDFLREAAVFFAKWLYDRSTRPTSIGTSGAGPLQTFREF